MANTKAQAAVERGEAITAVDKWLASKGTTLWSDWDISKPSRRLLAAEWFVRQIEQCVTWKEAQKEETA